MKNTVVIKGNKSGMTVILDPEAAYETLLLDHCRPSLKRAPDSGDLYR